MLFNNFRSWSKVKEDNISFLSRKILEFWYLRVLKELEQVSQHQIDCKFHVLSFYWGFRAIWDVPKKFRAKMCLFSTLSHGVVARIWADFDEFASKSGRGQKSSWIVCVQRDILLTPGLFHHQDPSWKYSGKIGFAPESDSKQLNSWENFFRYGISRRSGDTYLELVSYCYRCYLSRFKLQTPHALTAMLVY